MAVGLEMLNVSDRDTERINKINKNFKNLLTGSTPVGGITATAMALQYPALSSNDGFIRAITTPIVNSEYLSSKVVNTLYANIDEATVGKLDVNAANAKSLNVGKFFADTGLINNIQAGQSWVTGTLAAVHIAADSIDVNTINASKIVFDDGTVIYSGADPVAEFMSAPPSSVASGINKNKMDYETIKARAESLVASGEAKDLNEALNIIAKGIDGSTLVSKSVTAKEIFVTDLNALNATIAGFDIKDNSIEAKDGSFVLGKKSGEDVKGYLYAGTERTHLMVDPEDDRLEMKADTVEVVEDLTFASKWKLDYQPGSDQFALIYVG